MRGSTRRAYAEITSPAEGGIPIIEEWTAWFLVRERERELARQQRMKEAEETRATSQAAPVVRLPARATRFERPPRGRRAA